MRPPISQAFANERYRSFVNDNAAGQDVLAALNMFWLYFKDNPKAWHPSISFRYSFYQAAAIMGLDWKTTEWTFRPRHNYVHQMRIYGIEENRDSGRLEVRSVYRWRHAVAIARQTGRCPPSTFDKRYNDPECQPDDPVDPADLPPKRKRYTRGADPVNIEKEMIRTGKKDKTYDEKRRQWFSGDRQPDVPSVRDGRKLNFSQSAKAMVERLAR